MTRETKPEQKCGFVVDEFLNTTRHDRDAEITIDSTKGSKCDITVLVGGKNPLPFTFERDKEKPSGPHLVTVPAGKRLEIQCSGGQNPCYVKYTFRWS